MDILKTMGSALGGGDKQSDLIGIIMSFIGEQGGGLNGLVEKFTSKGLGDVVGSWIGSGDNLPITPDQIKDVLGSDVISNLASKTGMDSGSITGKLSELLPQVIDKLTPDGKVPEGDLLSQGKNLLGGLFGK